MISTVALLCLIPLTRTADTEEVPIKYEKKEDIEMYFQARRKQQLEAIHTLMGFKRYEQKYEMLRRIFEKIFEVILDSRGKVENSNYVLGDDLLQSTVVEPILRVLDNCAFFGRLVLKLPDISDRLLKLNNQWVDSYRWCFTFSVSTDLIDEKSVEMYNLAAQQLNLAPRSADFVNPYEETKTKQSLPKAKQQQLRKTKKKIDKGPRLSRVEL